MCSGLNLQNRAVRTLCQEFYSRKFCFFSAVTSYLSYRQNFNKSYYNLNQIFLIFSFYSFIHHVLYLYLLHLCPGCHSYTAGGRGSWTGSSLPITINFMGEPFVKKDPDEPGLFHIEFFRVANGILFFQILSNFFIYSLSVAGLRRFLICNFYKTVQLCLRTPFPVGNVPSRLS